MIRRAGIRRQIRRKPDFVLKTTIKTQHGAVTDVLCRVYLPRSVIARPYLHFEPTPQQVDALTVPEFSVEGKAEWHGQAIAIRAGTVFTEGWQRNRLSPDVVKCTLPGEPWDLEVWKQRATEAVGAPVKHAVFWLTPNMLLSPADPDGFLHRRRERQDCAGTLIPSFPRGATLSQAFHTPKDIARKSEFKPVGSPIRGAAGTYPYRRSR